MAELSDGGEQIAGALEFGVDAFLVVTGINAAVDPVDDGVGAINTDVNCIKLI